MDTKKLKIISTSLLIAAGSYLFFKKSNLQSDVTDIKNQSNLSIPTSTSTSKTLSKRQLSSRENPAPTSLDEQSPSTQIHSKHIPRSNPISDQPTNRDEMIKRINEKNEFFGGLPKVKKIINGEETFLLTTVFAKSTLQNSKERLQSNLTDEMLNFIPEAIGPYILYSTQQSNATLSLRESEQNIKYPVVIVDNVNHVLGIVNGEILLKKKPNVDTVNLLKKYNFSLVNEFAGSQKYQLSVRASTGVDFDQLLNSLDSDPDIDHSFPYIIDISTHFAEEQ